MKIIAFIGLAVIPFMVACKTTTVSGPPRGGVETPLKAGDSADRILHFFAVRFEQNIKELDAFPGTKPFAGAESDLNKAFSQESLLVDAQLKLFFVADSHTIKWDSRKTNSGLFRCSGSLGTYYCRMLQPCAKEGSAKEGSGDLGPAGFGPCIGLTALNMCQEVLPENLGYFLREYRFEEFDGVSDDCLKEASS